MTGISYEGCYPDSEVSPVYMYEDSSSMTVESCILACNGSGEDYVGLQVCNIIVHVILYLLCIFIKGVNILAL